MNLKQDVVQAKKLFNILDKLRSHKSSQKSKLDSVAERGLYMWTLCTKKNVRPDSVQVTLG